MPTKLTPAGQPGGIVAYYRIAAKKEGKRTKRLTREEVIILGLEIQRRQVSKFAAETSAPIIAEYIEVETPAAKRQRPKLAEAIARARRSQATLVIATLGRLSRNVRFLSTLMDSGVEFACCDNRKVDKSTIHIMAAVAEAEADAISKRTRETLAILKREGVKFGSARPDAWKGKEHLRGWRQGARASAKARTEYAQQAYEFLVPKMRELVAEATAKAEAMSAQAVEAARKVREEWEPRIAEAKARVRKRLPGAEKALRELVGAMREAQRKAREQFSYPIYPKVAERLNEAGHFTTAGMPFNGPTVYRILQRAEGRKPQKRTPKGDQTGVVA